MRGEGRGAKGEGEGEDTGGGNGRRWLGGRLRLLSFRRCDLEMDRE